MNTKIFFITLLVLAGLSDLVAVPRAGRQGGGNAGNRGGGASMKANMGGAGRMGGAPRASFNGGAGRMGGAPRTSFNRSAINRGASGRSFNKFNSRAAIASRSGQFGGPKNVNRQSFVGGRNNFTANRATTLNRFNATNKSFNTPGRGSFGGNRFNQAGRPGFNTGKSQNVQALRQKMGNPRNPQLAKSLSPTRTFNNRSSKFNKYRSEDHLREQRSFLDRDYRGHHWNWWYRNNPYFFYSYFPNYFYRSYGYYPPIYYDFYDAYGFYPVSSYATPVYTTNNYINQYEQEPVYDQYYNYDSYEDQGDLNLDNQRTCVQNCLNNTNNTLGACLDGCGAA